MGYMTNGVDTGGLPFHLVKPLLNKYKIPYLVETGTASGESARLASIFFSHVWTMELIDDRQEKEDSPDNITWLVGDSVELLPKIIEEISQTKVDGSSKYYVLFYLDAHYSGDKENETGFPECPVLKEIEAIAERGYESIIIIDDARLFLGHPPHPHNPEEWPSILEIFTLLKEKFPYHHITITDDYILAIPLHVRDVIDKEWRERFPIRYPNAKDKLRSQVKDVYKAFMEDVYKPFMDYIK
jgi:hypothetical protein